MVDGGDYTRKECLKLYFHCGPSKTKLKVQNVGNIKAKADTKFYENLEAICQTTVWKTSKRKHCRYF